MHLLAAVLGMALLLSGCDRAVRLAAAPNVYAGLSGYPAADVPRRLRLTAPEVFYVTDRQPVAVTAQGIRYGVARSDSMAFGQARVTFGNVASWDRLVRLSMSGIGASQPVLRVDGIEELVRFSSTPLPFARSGGRLTILPGPATVYRDQMAAFQARIAREVAQDPRGEVMVYVHGFNNQFEDGVATLTNLWHYTGRRGVPIAFSWPSGNPGLTGYFKDSESAEYSVFHFKEFMRNLAAIPAVKKINVVAHSRGTELTSTALRELIIFETGAGHDPHISLKLGSLIMAAPDIDLPVVRQRLVAEHFAGAFDQIDVYVNPADAALGLTRLIGAGKRFGQISASDFTPEVLGSLERTGNVFFINVENPGGALGHSYFSKNPGAVSDIILTLRSGAKPGSRQRPLDNVSANFWTVHPEYPLARPPPPP